MGDICAHVARAVSCCCCRPQSLDGVNLNLQAVECVGLLGASGSGKSTLLRSVCGLKLFDDKDSAVTLFGETL